MWHSISLWSVGKYHQSESFHFKTKEGWLVFVNKKIKLHHKNALVFTMIGDKVVIKEIIFENIILFIYIIEIVRNNHLTYSRWPNEYDQSMTMTNINNWIWPEPWQQQTLFIEYDWNWNPQTLWNWQTLTLHAGSS